MRRMQKINPASAKQPGQVDLFSNRIILELYRKFFRVRCRSCDHLFGSRKHDQQVLVLRFAGKQALHQTFHIPANTWVLDPA